MADEAQQAPSPSPPRFTARELAAAEQLIHLSESSCSSHTALPRGSVASVSSTSSPPSVNAPPLPPATPAPAPPPAAEDDEEEEEDEDQQEVGGRRRRNKRYRPIAEIYAASEPKPIGAAGARRRPRTDGTPKARK